MKKIAISMFTLIFVTVAGLMYLSSLSTKIKIDDPTAVLVKINRIQEVALVVQEEPEIIDTFISEANYIEDSLPIEGESELVFEDIEVPFLIEEVSIPEESIEVVVEEIPEEIIEEVVIIPANDISIIISDVSNGNIDSIIKYFSDNKNIGLAFAYGSKDAMKKAKEAGFDNLIASVAMEPFNEDILLPLSTIKVDNSAEKNIEVLNIILAETYMPIAVMNEMGSKITSKKHIDTLKPVMVEIKSKNLAFIDSKSNFYSVAGNIAEEVNVDFAENYTFIDKDISSEEVILKALNGLKYRADEKGSVLAVGNYSAKLIKTLDSWLNDLTENYQLVSIQENM